MISGTVLVFHTEVVSDHPQKSVEVKWAVVDRIKDFTLKILIKPRLDYPRSLTQKKRLQSHQFVVVRKKKLKPFHLKQKVSPRIMQLHAPMDSPEPSKKA